MKKSFTAIVGFLITTILTGRIGLAQEVFTEIAGAVGIQQLTISFDLMGGGCAFFDFNKDGFEDLVVAGGAVQDRLFKNNGDGTFTDVTSFARLNNDHYHDRRPGCQHFVL
jgi:hypothetical protein